MKRFLGFFLKLVLIILGLFFSIFVVMGINALLEKPPGHPLDFQDINNIVIEEPIHSVEDGLPYATDRAYEWRDDSVLTGLVIISTGKDEIENRNGMLNYQFQFNYIDKSKPSGKMFIYIDTNTNNIEMVDVKHNDVQAESINELKTYNINEKIRKVYDISLEAIGRESVFQYEEPLTRLYINSNFGVFEVSSVSNPNTVKHKVKIDMQTYEILLKE